MLPKVIHRIWIGGREPAWLAEYGRTWAEHHPHWEITQWDDTTIEGLFPLENQDTWDIAAQLVDAGHLPQLRADLLRYTILWRFGGLYIDADFKAIRPIDPLIEGLDSVSAFEIQDTWAVNGFLGATAGHRFIRRLIDGIPHSVDQHRGEAPTRITGPQYLTGIWRQHPDELTVLDQKHLFPYQPSAADVKAFPVDYHFDPDDWPDLYAVHAWRNRRRKMGALRYLEP